MIPVETGAVLAVLATIAAMILLYMKVLPRKFDGTFNSKFIQFLHDFFHFKKLYVEEVLKFFFVLATVTCVCFGVFVLRGYQEGFDYNYYTGTYETTKESTFLYGLLITVVGPVVLRLTYELAMLAIMLVKNVIDINNKMPKKEAPAVSEPKVEAPQAEEPKVEAPQGEAAAISE